MGNKNSSHKAKDKGSQSLFDTAHVPLETKARFKKQDLKMLESLFVGLEDDKNHTLDKSTFLKLFPRASGLLGERLYLQFDSSNDGVIDFNEFLNGIGLYIKGQEDKKVEFLFKMFDYNHSDQLTRDGLTLMLHALIQVDEASEQQGEDELQFMKSRQSLHALSIPSVDSMDSISFVHHEMGPDMTTEQLSQKSQPQMEQNNNNGINNNNNKNENNIDHVNNNNNNNPPLTAGNITTTTSVSSAIIVSNADDNNPSNDNTNIKNQNNNNQNIDDDNNDYKNNNNNNTTIHNNDDFSSKTPPPRPSVTPTPSLQHQPSYQQHLAIDPRLLAEENRIANLLSQLHDLTDITALNHINIIREITIASQISPEQERLTIEQLVSYAFNVTPCISPDNNNPSTDYMALQHFTKFISRNPSILEHLEDVLNCAEWLDPRCGTEGPRATVDQNKENGGLVYIDDIPQVLCCLNCGFSVRHCPSCGSGLTPHANKTFSVCNNESTGLCRGWSTEGLFKYCLQCGDRMQAETTPATLLNNNDVVVVSVFNDQIGANNSNGANNGSNGAGTSPRGTSEVAFKQTNTTQSRPNSRPTSSIRPVDNATRNKPTVVYTNSHTQLNLPELSANPSNQSNISALSLQTTDQQPNRHHHSIPESPNHKNHTSLHGYHDNYHVPVNQTRSNRTSSHHLSYTPSKHYNVTSNSHFVPNQVNSAPIATPGGIINNNHHSLTNLHNFQTFNRYGEIANSHSSHHHATTHKQAVHYEGQVFVRSNGIIKHLKSRWLLCRGGFLYLFREREDREPQTVLFLEGTYISPLDEDTDEETAKDKDLYGFEIKSKSHRYTFYMKQHDQRQSWIKILRQASKTQQIENFYTFQKQVGKGKFATVYKATSRLNPDRFYAIKVISKLLMEKPEHLEQLRAEISIIKLAHHPNIIRMKEMFEDPHNIYLVMPLISGGDMFDRLLARKIFPETTTRTIMWRLLSAVDYLHDREIVHCDIKPENILLLDDQEDDNVILADFGLSSFFDPGCDGLHKQQGTISYLAPEVLRGEYYSKSIDVYALGVCAYLFLSGELPFQGFTQDEIIDQTLKGEVHFEESWNNISLAARLFVQQLLSPNPANRPSAAQAMLDPWFDPIRTEVANSTLQQVRFKKTFSTHSTAISSNMTGNTGGNHANNGNVGLDSATSTPQQQYSISLQPQMQHSSTQPQSIATTPQFFNKGNGNNNVNGQKHQHSTPQPQLFGNKKASLSLHALSAHNPRSANNSPVRITNTDNIEVLTQEEADLVVINTSPRVNK